MELKISNVSKTYKNGVKALDNLSLTINNGMFGLLGPNGAGKSTLMRIISTLQDADEGTIFLDDIDVLNQKMEIKKILGYLPQEFGVYPKISAIELLNHYAILKGITNGTERKEAVKSLLNQVNLYDKRKKYVNSFSGGMKQRFGIAMALLGNPKLIIVDEPAAGLDPGERVRFNNLLSDISEDKIVILSTHIVGDVSDLCTDMAIVNEGKLIFNGNPQDMISELKGKIWEKKIRKEEIEVYKEQHKVVFSYLQGGHPIIHVFDENTPGAGFEKINPKLEDVYFTAIN